VKQTGIAGRNPNRKLKTLSLPNELVETIQEEADKKFGGDFNRAVLEKLATIYPEAEEFLRTCTTLKHSRKKF
jgi:hypothetical protein